MKSINRFIFLAFIAILGTGCATKVLQVEVPAGNPPDSPIAYVKIEDVQDSRKFERAPRNPSTPSIEGDLIDDKNLTDKSIGRMRHGMFQRALWNYTFKGEDDIYSVCSKIVESSLMDAGYQIVTPDQSQYSQAIPINIEILQFWAWIQPKFTIDMHFDGELKVTSTSQENPIDVTAQGSDFFSTPAATRSAWTKAVNNGVASLQQDLTEKLKER